MINYDTIIKRFVNEWEKDSDHYSSCIKTACMSLMIPSIYESLRKVYSPEELNIFKNRSFSCVYEFLQGITHCIWYIAWGLKWLLFHLKLSSNKRVILTSIFNKKSSYEIIDQIKDSSDYLFLHFSILYSYKLLVCQRFYCYPYFFYKLKNGNEVEKFRSHFLFLYKKYFRNEFTYIRELNTYLNKIIGIYFTFNSLLRYINKKSNCICLIQDCDYLAERVIFTTLCNYYSIETLSYDHSIMLNDHLFLNTSSNIKLVWGEHQLARIKKYSEQQPKKIIITGKPGGRFEYLPDIREKHLWIYFLPAFQNAHMQSMQRSISDTASRIQDISSITNVNNKKFLIKPHPSNHYKNNQFGIDIINKPMKKFMQGCQLAFVEDSTIALELLNYDTKVIYFSDKLSRDTLHIERFKVDFVVCRSQDNLVDKINEVFAKPINRDERFKMFKYYFGDYLLNLPQMTLKNLNNILNAV